MAEMLSDTGSHQQKILKQRTRGDQLNPPRKLITSAMVLILDSLGSNDAPKFLDYLLRSHPWIMRIRLWFLILINYNVSNGQKHLADDMPLGNISKRQQMRFSFGERKVILEVPYPTEDVNRASDFVSEIKKDVKGKHVPLLTDGHNVGRQKRGSGNLINEVSDSLLNSSQNKKLRPEEQLFDNHLYQGATCR